MNCETEVWTSPRHMFETDGLSCELHEQAVVLADGLAVGRINTPKGGGPGPHAHNYFQLILPVRDLALTRVRLAELSFQTFPKQSSLLVWPAGQEGEIQTDGPFHSLSLRLGQKRIEREATLLFGDRSVAWIQKEWPQDPFVYESARQLLALTDDEHQLGKNFLAEGIGVAITRHILLRYSRPAHQSDALTALSPSALAAVVAFVDKHIDERVSISRMAEVAGLSRYHFSRLFRVATGESPHQFVLSRRLELAASLLEGGILPIAEIGFCSGFASQSHLHQHFKNHYGITPGAYRRQKQLGRNAPPSIIDRSGLRSLV